MSELRTGVLAGVLNPLLVARVGEWLRSNGGELEAYAVTREAQRPVRAVGRPRLWRRGIRLEHSVEALVMAISRSMYDDFHFLNSATSHVVGSGVSLSSCDFFGGTPAECQAVVALVANGTARLELHEAVSEAIVQSGEAGAEDMIIIRREDVEFLRIRLVATGGSPILFVLRSVSLMTSAREAETP